ncbi:hypothetical protein QR680_017349 [Steinernema hermaphroditum]|uniref:RING-type E3 ubiquitin transferase (cysteine targeting) n=1 Tax=Steinernema hermaphroditum TaxID=289476 RepID=A0AA39LNZ2_9BILA|nr:hypothetical protein QR680_017349 [Steinernema hermaphroditum]
MALRVGQIDARILDSEVEALASDAVDRLISSLPVAVAISMEKIRPEIRLVVRAVLWSHRLLKGRSIGQEFLNLHYPGYGPRRVLLHFLFEAILPYASVRVLDLVPSRHHRIRRLLARLETWSAVVSLLVHFYFLRSGGFSSLVERLLGLRPTYTTPARLGLINFDALNRELLWYSFRDVIVLALPLFRAARLVWRRSLASADVDVSSGFEWKCARCAQTAVIPTQRNRAAPDDKAVFCPHVFCYYCYTSEVCCERCGKPLDDRFPRFATGKPIRP